MCALACMISGEVLVRTGKAPQSHSSSGVFTCTLQARCQERARRGGRQQRRHLWQPLGVSVVEARRQDNHVTVPPLGVPMQPAHIDTVMGRADDAAHALDPTILDAVHKSALGSAGPLVDDWRPPSRVGTPLVRTFGEEWFPPLYVCKYAHGGVTGHVHT
jgi:hypothetical protein